MISVQRWLAFFSLIYLSLNDKLLELGRTEKNNDISRNGTALVKDEKQFEDKVNNWGWLANFMGCPGESLHIVGQGETWKSNKREELSILMAYIWWQPTILNKSAKSSDLYPGTLSQPDRTWWKVPAAAQKGRSKGNHWVRLYRHSYWEAVKSQTLGKGCVQSCTEPPKCHWKSNVPPTLLSGGWAGAWSQDRKRSCTARGPVAFITACWAGDSGIPQSPAGVTLLPYSALHRELWDYGAEGGWRATWKS